MMHLQIFRYRAPEVLLQSSLYDAAVGEWLIGFEYAVHIFALHMMILMIRVFLL